METFNICDYENHCPDQYPISRLTVRSRKDSKPGDLYLKLHNRSKNWQAPRLNWCKVALISKRCGLPNSRFRYFTISLNKTFYRILKRGPGALFLQSDRGCYNIGNPSETNLRIKSRLISFFHNIHFSATIDCVTTMLCTKWLGKCKWCYVRMRFRDNWVYHGL